MRQADERLLWLETDRWSAFTNTSGEVTADESSLVPRDTGAEAQALRSLDALSAWLDARGQADSPAAAAPYLDRPTDSVVLRTSDDRTITAIRDRETGIILHVHGQSLRGSFEVRVTSVEIVKGGWEHSVGRGP